MHHHDIGLALIHNPLIHSADVIFVHGLRGHRCRTWETKSGKFWLEWLGTLLPEARVWSYGYDAHTISGSQDVFHLYATQFLSEISSHLSHDKNNATIEKPIVFVAHSLGGILVKKAMILASSAKSGWNCIFRNTAGILFLGTPHRGSPLASAASSISKRIPGSSQLLPILQANSSTLAQIADRFNNLWGSRPLFSFRETTGTLGFMMIVPQENAATNCQNETVYDIPGCNHSEISKPDSVDGILFHLIHHAILSLLQPKSTSVYSSNVGLHNSEPVVKLPLESY